MNRINTLRDLHRHFDWARDRVMAAATHLSDDALDRGFEMGFGTLRKTLWHINTCEEIWFTRILGMPLSLAPDRDHGPLSALEASIAGARAMRQRIFESLSEDELDRLIHYNDLRGNPRTAVLGHLLLHVCNHAAHHHAQALNMLRHAGVKPPKIDYLFMYYENPDLPPPPHPVAQVREYFDYTDWARGLVMELIESLDEAALDRPFEMGPGSIRKTLVHIHAAEQFWVRNWHGPHEHPFGKADEPVPLKEIVVRFNETAARRDQFLAQKTDGDLLEPAEARLPDGRTLRFPLGVTVVQLCMHDTHHRAQLINMLRHCGLACPETDYNVWKQQQTPAAKTIPVQ